VQLKKALDYANMLIFLPFFLFAPLFALSAPVPIPALAKRYYPWNAVTWTTALRIVQADTTYTLSWKGGSGSGYVCHGGELG